MPITYKDKNNSFEDTRVYSQVRTQVEGMIPADGEAFGEILLLECERGVSRFNFGWFDLDGYSAAKNYLIKIDGQDFLISTSTLAWLLWCDGVSDLNNNKTRKDVFEVLLLLFGHLTQEGISEVSAQSLNYFLEVMMTYAVNEKGLSKRLGIRGVGIFNSFKPRAINSICSQLGLKPIMQPFTKKRLAKALNEVAVQVADMSFTDYKEGGSFNFLTLDIGKHYINHLNTVFNQNFFAAYAAAHVINQTKEMLAGYADTSRNLFLMKHALAGGCVSALSGSNRKSEKAFREIEYRVKISYKAAYREAVEHFGVFNEFAINEFVERLGLNPSDDNRMFVKSLLAVDLSSSDITSSELISDFSDGLSYSPNTSILSLQKYLTEKKALIKSLLKQNTPTAPSEDLSPVGSFSRNIGRIGFTQIMALLGWRESEYTFPESAIHLFRNNDVIDQGRYPIRFQVKWKVPKTAGETKLNREITLNSYILLKQLQAIQCANSEEPMLYQPSEEGDIGTRAKQSCIWGWKDFVERYLPFVDLDAIDFLQEKRSKNLLDSGEQKKLARLSDTYHSVAELKALRVVRDKVRTDYPKLVAAGSLTIGGKKRGMNLISTYIDETMEIEEQKIWDERLSYEQKQYLKTITPYSKLDRGTVGDIINSIKAGCAYPTPHAFRHMWAECVYRRYSGDVGWLIRTNFKHFGEQFYRRYLREKHMQTSEDVAKRRVVSSILNSHLNSMKHDQKREFGGKMDVFLRRVLKQTKVVKPEEIGRALNEFASLEIADIKANPWGYCMLKNRNKQRANCAVEGVPQRENAGIEFCIGCTNHLVEQEHVAFIILNVANHVTTLKQPLPTVFKVESQRIVKETIKTLKQLDKNSNTSRNEKYINEMQSAIDMSGKIEVEAV